MQKSQLDKERLYFHYAKGFSLDELASQFQDDLPEFMEFYTLARGRCAFFLAIYYLALK